MIPELASKTTVQVNFFNFDLNLHHIINHIVRSRIFHIISTVYLSTFPDPESQDQTYKNFSNFRKSYFHQTVILNSILRKNV